VLVFLNFKGQNVGEHHIRKHDDSEEYRLSHVGFKVDQVHKQDHKGKREEDGDEKESFHNLGGC
jgi:hypothetical protein